MLRSGECPPKGGKITEWCPAASSAVKKEEKEVYSHICFLSKGKMIKFSIIHHL
jgi:hypothetical protein